MAYTPRKHRPWLKSHATQPRPASVLALLLFFGVSLASFGGCLALLFAHSLRDVHFERRPGATGAVLTVEWRFAGHRFWQRHWPDIVNVEARQITMTRNPGVNQIEDVITHTVFIDAHQNAVLTLRNSSLHDHVKEMQEWLSPTAKPGELAIHEANRWWTTEPVKNMIWCAVGLIVGFALGAFFLVGAVSALWVRISGKSHSRGAAVT